MHCDGIRDHGYMLSPPQLHSLEFSHCKLGALLRYFLDERIVPTNLLSIKGLRPEGIPVVGEYFSMFGNVLREIEISIEWASNVLGTSDITLRSAITHLLFPSARSCDDARWQCLTGLQCLTIHTTHVQSFLTHHIELLASILQKIPSSTIKELCIEIPSLLITLRIPEWHRIGEVLEQRRFPQLTHVVLKLPPNADGVPRGPGEKWLRESLYMLEERGILYVR